MPLTLDSRDQANVGERWKREGCCEQARLTQVVVQAIRYERQRCEGLCGLLGADGLKHSQSAFWHSIWCKNPLFRHSISYKIPITLYG